MTGIIHYEVYAFQKNNWNLLARYPSEQRAEALEYAKDVEKQEHFQVKVLRETYNLTTQEFQESLVYLSEAPPPPKTVVHNLYANANIPTFKKSPPPAPKKSDGALAKGLFVLTFSIIISLIISAILTSGLAHLVVAYKLITSASSSLFSLICFILFFLLLALPICSRTVDWEAFTQSKTADNKRRPAAKQRPVPTSQKQQSAPAEKNQLHLSSKELYGKDPIKEDVSLTLLSRIIETLIDSFDLLIGRTPFSQRLREDKERLRKELELQQAAEEEEEYIEEPVEEPAEETTAEEPEEPEQTESDSDSEDEEEEEEKNRSVLPPELEDYYLKMTAFLSVILRVLQNRNFLLNTYTRFGLELFLAGACEQLCHKNNLSKNQNQLLLSSLLILLGRSQASAETFFYKQEEYALEAKYLPMIENGAESMRFYSANPSSPEVISLIQSAMENWVKPDQKDIPSSGICTIMFTDMVSSTHMTQVLGDHLAQQLIHLHNSIVREALRTCGGTEVKHTGDGIMASFLWASNAIDAAIAIQRAVAKNNLQSPTVPLEIRIGLNAGEPIVEDNDLFGQTVQLASRICGQAGAGQIYVSSVVKELSAGKNYTFTSLGDFSLKGINDPLPIYEVVWENSAPQTTGNNAETASAASEEKDTEEHNLSEVLPEL